MVAAIDAALASQEEGDDMNDEALLDGFDPAEHEEEVRERWGDTDAWRQSRQRTKTYGTAEHAEIRRETDGIAERFAAVKRAGEEPDSEPAMGAAEAHRQHIHRWFYDCSPQMHASVATLYTEDARFQAFWDDREPGLAAFVRAAVEANAARSG